MLSQARSSYAAAVAIIRMTPKTAASVPASAVWVNSPQTYHLSSVRAHCSSVAVFLRPRLTQALPGNLVIRPRGSARSWRGKTTVEGWRFLSRPVL